MSLRKTIRIEINKLKELPPLTGSTQDILIAVNNHDIPLDDLCRVLEESPPLVARLVSLANSAYFGMPGTVHSIRHAVIKVLGLNIVKSLTIGILLSEALDVDNCPSFNNEQFWFTSVATANLSQNFCSLAEESSAVEPTAAYTAGLLSNIGLLALVHKFPEAMDLVFREANSTDRSLSHVLKDYYDLDQYESGVWLAQRWNLPELVKTVIAHHMNTSYSGQYDAVTGLIGVCASISKSLYNDPEPDLDSAERLADLGVSREKATDELLKFCSRSDELRKMASAMGIQR